MKKIIYNGSSKVIQRIVELLNEKVAVEDYPFEVINGEVCCVYDEEEESNALS